MYKEVRIGPFFKGFKNEEIFISELIIMSFARHETDSKFSRVWCYFTIVVGSASFIELSGF